MKTGYARVCINPPYGAPVVGYYEKRFVKGIADDLFVRCVAFDDGEEKALIIALDLCHLTNKEYDVFKDAIVEATGVARDAIFINCSHIHSGPAVGVEFANKLQAPDYYSPFVTSCVRDAAVYAIADLKQSSVETADGEAKGIAFIRRYRMKDGTVMTNPGFYNENIDHPLAEANETVKLVKILREDGDDIFIINFGTHPDAVGGEIVSADYIGYVCSILERCVPNTKCIFLQGAQGDVVHDSVYPTPGERKNFVTPDDPRSLKVAEHIGQVLAGAVLSVCSITEPVKTDKITYGSKTVQLPTHQENDRLEEMQKIYDLYKAGRYDLLPQHESVRTTMIAEAARIIRLKNGPESIPFHLSVVKIGDLVFAGVGGEPFTELGNRIKDESSYKNTVLCALTNSQGGYIPTRKAYEEGGYEVCSSSLAPGGDDIIANGMKDLLAGL